MEVTAGRVIRWANRPIGPDILKDEVIVDPPALSKIINQLMNESRIGGGKVTASVGGLYSLSRIMVVPGSPGGHLTQEMVVEVANEVMPLTEEELYLSWQAIAAPEEEQQVLVVGVPHDIIDGEIQALRGAGLKVSVLELRALALIRAVNREQAFILNIESTSFDVILVTGSVPVVMRTVAWNQDALSEDEKAEQLAVALEMTAGFYNSHNPAFPLDLATPLFITGWMSVDSALIENLQARVAYPVEPFTPPLQYPEHLPVSQYAVNIGLALKGVAPSKVIGDSDFSPPNINLLPQIYRPWRPSTRQISAFFVFIAALVLLFPSYQILSKSVGETTVLNTRYTIINDALQQRQVVIKDREPLQEAINQYRTIMNMGSGFTEDINFIYSSAEEIGITVQSITHAGNSITVICQADTPLAFDNYLTALEASGRFSTPIPPPEGYPYISGGTIKLEPKPIE